MKKTVKQILIDHPPTNSEGFAFPLKVYIFPNDLVYNLYGKTELPILLEITRHLVEMLFELNKLPKGKVVFYYPETYLPPSFQQRFMKLIKELGTAETEYVQIVTNSPLIVHGLNRHQLLSGE